MDFEHPYSSAPHGTITTWWTVTGPETPEGTALSLMFQSPDTASAVATALNAAYQLGHTSGYEQGHAAATLEHLHQPAGYQAGYQDGAARGPYEGRGGHNMAAALESVGLPLPAEDLSEDTMGTQANWPDPGAAGNR